MKKQSIKITVNGEKQEIWIEPNALLINVLREGLGLTGTKYGCGIGQCGGCTLVIDGEAVLSCLTLAASVDGSEIFTVEGVEGPDGSLDPLQASFLDHSAVQCGYCTPGLIVSAKALLDQNPDPTREEIREGICGNLCRCTGYTKIVEAIEDAASKR